MYQLLRPLLFGMDAERAHGVSTGAARLVQAVRPDALEPLYAFADPMLHQSLWGRTMRNPVGLAAGMDKNARLVRFWDALDFGFVEVGSVSAEPSDGNPKPRVFRLPEEGAIINRMGLNNEGAERVAERLRALREEQSHEEALPPLGVNLAKTHDPDVLGKAAVDDFRHSFRALAPLADYVALNVSCPNTGEGKTFEEPPALRALLDAVFAERSVQDAEDTPVLLKLAPPVSERVAFDSQLDALLDVALERDVEGFIAANTASDRTGLSADAETLERIGEGGLSGKPLEARSTQLVRLLYRRVGDELPIIGVGGVDGPEAAYRKIRAGARLVQCYTGLVYEGPGLVKTINQGLVRRLEDDGFGSLTDAVGADA
jgi:dihydroorotate dehydrogenase